MKIAFFEVENWEKEHINKFLGKYNIVFFEEELNKKNVEEIKDFDIVSVFIYSKIDLYILKRFENLKAIATRSTGFDHIDINSCKKEGIKVFNVPSYGENTVAEHTFALILALSKNIIKSCEKSRVCNFDVEGLRGFDLKGKTIGIVGMGRIGQHVANIAKGFEMKIISNSEKKDITFSKKIGFTYVRFDYLLKNSDIITFHVPLTKKTRHMINMKNINTIKKGAYLINTSRGGVVDTTALLKALEKKIIAGAGLDVLEEEELVKEEKELLHKKHSREELCNFLENHALLKYDNVIVTPHNAFNTQEALERILNTTVENIKSAISTKVKMENLIV